MSEPTTQFAAIPAFYSQPTTQSNPIDLTGEDDGSDCDYERKSKRLCPQSRAFDAFRRASATSGSNAPSQPDHSGLSPAMSHSSLYPDLQPPVPSQYSQIRPTPTPEQSQMLPPPRALFCGPSDSSAFFPPPSSRHQPGPTLAPILQPIPSIDASGSSSSRPGSIAPHNADPQVIDLTGSPSPPPHAHPPLPQQTQSPLPPDLPPKTPVCIGQLTVTALVLYSMPYLQPQRGILSPDGDWAPVRMSYENNGGRPGSSETIHIRTPNMAGPNGEVITGDNFGVVEQKVATLLGPMLGKGLIRLDGKVRRGQPNSPILPLGLLVFTPKGNIAVVATYLHQHSLFLDHPTCPTDIQRLKQQHYWNPHNPPPGGHARAMFGPIHQGGTVGRWNTVSGKSVEVQRSQVDELFKSLKDGDELPETEPPPEVATKLYPHQKKALTFMLEREAELPITGGASLWQARFNSIANEKSWYHVVTQREVFEEPRFSKGAILADDMGLGKTISCVSLIAATLRSAYNFAATPLEPPVPPPCPTLNESQLTAAHFAGSVWGMPLGSTEPTSAKGKAKAAREHDKLESEYVRSCRLKTKSRATLIICPLSTVVNWEEQFREHWRGVVEVVGGTGSSCIASQSQSSSGTPCPEVKPEAKPSAVGRVREGTPLRVYVYHGNARKPDPTFLADFDAVITTYSTLAVEFSKQLKSLDAGDEEEDDAGSSDGIADADERGNPVIKLNKSKKGGAKKRKKPCSGTVCEASSALQSVHWFRVVLDEAHSIKEINTVACRASCDLVADRRLCLTGTPVQNKLDDVFALLKFLKLEPFDEKAVWTEFIGTPVKYGQTVGVARLQSIMKYITLRRTKESKAENGQRILCLPPRRDELRLLKFDEHEKAIYDQFFTESKAEFTELSKQNEVMKNYVGILQKILRLRQICDHFELVMNKGLGLIGDAQTPEAPNYDELAAVIANEGINLSRATAIFCLLREAGTAQCVECGYELGIPPDDAEGDALCEAESSTAKRGRKPKNVASRASTRQNSPTGPIQVILTRCQHLFCVGCFRNSTCPSWPAVSPDCQQPCGVCRTPLTANDAVNFIPDMMNTVDVGVKKKSGKKEKRQKGVVTMENYHASTKIKALLTDLAQFSRGNPYSSNYDPSSIEVQMVDNKGNNVEDGVVKTVVFSQWTTMLDKIEDALELARIRYDRLDGTMKRDERTRAMEALKHDPGCEVLLVSLKAGGVGLNLTAAQRVYLMDPYWNPAVENQAVDRIHRLGQTRPVTTVKLVIEGSIEARLLEVQRKKTELANMTLGQNFSKAELLQRRIEELNQLFG
ncbi:SNF2 family N-terminal domain-containing protein [Irpex rosettiformis]|uniref:SNF2 family N-terminal domain-containing protein n=1 Tax=Irpex rosettiformis TaxID=378272 RepID=A0ACB8UJ00_9APHY|nr:SNF2 family N-terminal domain-containing protein [Irpex rosettiformis]